MSELDQQRLGELLCAYLDDELDAEQAQAVQRIVAQDPQAGRLLEDLRGTRRALAELPRHEAPPSILQGIESRLERAELLAEPKEGPATFARGASPLRWLSMAAMVAITVIGGTWVIFSGRQPGQTQLALDSGEKKGTKETLRDEAQHSPPVGALGRQTTSADKISEGSRRVPADRKITESLAKSAGTPAARSGLEERDTASIPRESRITQEHPLRLKLTVGSEAERTRLLAALASTVRSYRVGSRAPRPTAAPERSTSRTRPTFRGDAAQPRFDRDSSVILVRVPVKRIDAFAAELHRLGGEREVALSAEPFQFRGWEEARFALGRAGDSARAVRRQDESEDAKVIAPTAPFSERLAWLTEALDALGVDQPRPAELPATAGEPAALETSSPGPDLQDAGSAGELRLADATAGDGEQAAGATESASARPTSVSALRRRVAETTGPSAERGERAGIDDERVTLVQRRRSAVRERSAGRAAVAEPETNAHGVRRQPVASPADGAFITLAIEVEVEEPPRARSGASPGSARDESPQPRSSDQVKQ